MSKKRLLGMILAIEAVVCIVFSFVWREQLDSNIFKMFEIPFELIGGGLRYLSLSNQIGNIIALIIYFIICLLPIVVGIYHIKNNKLKWEEVFLLILSALMFWGIYIFINPGKIMDIQGVITTESMYKMEIITTIISVIVLYVVIKIVRSFEGMKENMLVRVLKIICAVSLMVIVVGVCLTGLTSLLENMQQALNNNQYIKSTCSILIFRFVVEQLPNICLFVIIIRLIDMSVVLKKGFINQEMITKVNEISDLCKKSIVIILFAIALLNAMQLMMTGIISIANYNVSIPVFSILAIAVLLIITKIIAESYKIKEDNDLFI